MENVVFVPSSYVMLTKNESSIYVLYHEVSGLIIDCLIPSVIHKPFNEMISLYLGNGYTETQRGRCTLEKYKELKDKYG